MLINFETIDQNNTTLLKQALKAAVKNNEITATTDYYPSMFWSETFNLFPKDFDKTNLENLLTQEEIEDIIEDLIAQQDHATSCIQLDVPVRKHGMLQVLRIYERTTESTLVYSENIKEYLLSKNITPAIDIKSNVFNLNPEIICRFVFQDGLDIIADTEEEAKQKLEKLIKSGTLNYMLDFKKINYRSNT